MSLITVFIDKKLLAKIHKLILDRVAQSEQEVFRIALEFLVKAIDYCHEKGIDLRECFDRVIDFVFS